MSWLGSFFVAVLTAILTALAAGLVAAGCVEWYHISSREGGSGYFVVAIGLLGGFAGFLAGLILTRFMGGAGVAGFFKGLGASAGSTLGLAGVAALLCWLLADIPPTIHGHELVMEVEARLPKGANPPEPGGPAFKDLQFISSNPFTHAYRASRDGTFEIGEAKQVDGRWVIPGSVFIFTTRGERSIAIPTAEREAIGFVVEFPAHPGAKHEQWSEWLPKVLNGKPWPDTEISYRYRITEVLPATPPPDPAVVAEAEFAALTPDAPLQKWLSYLLYGMPEDRERRILDVVEARPADLVQLLDSSNSGEFDKAIFAVSRLRKIDPSVTKAMLEIGMGIQDQIRKFNTMKPDQPGYYELGNDIRNKFKAWHNAWWNVHHRTDVDGRPPVEAILDLAKVQKDSGHMQEVADDAQAHLNGMKAEGK